MKKVFLIFMILGFSCASLAISTKGGASSDLEKSSSTSNKKPGDVGASSSTNHNFEDLLVQGKYHFSDSAVTTVEADKVFDSLIGVRTDFKDRLQESSSKY